MSHTPVGGHPQGWDKLADRSSLPPATGEERGKSQSKHVFAQPQLPKMQWREETEGSSASSAPSSASPPYMRWARTLHDLLEDVEGVRLFRKFVSGAGGLHVDRLNFYFAMRGLREVTDQDKIRQTVHAIYKFLRKSQLAMPEQLRQTLKQSLKDGSYIDRTIFDAMEQEVIRSITESTYQAFLRSEAYVSYVSAATQPLSSPETSPPAPAVKDPSIQGGMSSSGGGSALATLHEGQELGAAGGLGAPRLTHDALLATQTRRLRAEPAPGGLSRSRSVYAAHHSYGGFCPSSRVDSERASLSSGRTDSDAVSLSGSSVDGMSLRRERESRRRPRLHGYDPHAAMLNKEQDTTMVIPRTQRMQAEQFRVLPPAEFAPILIEKLERVKRDQETKERLERRLAGEGDGEEAALQALPPQLVAAAIREKLQVDDDDDQDILDQHVSRVWSERTPGASPPPGPPGAPAAAAAAAARSRARASRRRAPSTVSADSGLVDDRHRYRRSFSKKTATELTDSGVSVVSEGTVGSAVQPRILLWMAEGLARRDHRDHRDHSSRGSSADRKPSLKTRGSGSKSSSTSQSATSVSAATEQCTVVVLTFLDENVPYRLKVPSSPLTLKALKDYLPRKGNYRYFFKTECADLDNTVIQEEVSNDNDILPMFEGKVMARVKSLD